MPRRFLIPLTILIAYAFLFGAAAAQFQDMARPSEDDWNSTDPAAARWTSEGKKQTERWRFGLVITAAGGGFRNLVGTATVPIDWPEQKVRIIDTEVPPGGKITYKTIDGTVRQMIARIPRLAAGAEARAVVTFEITRTLQLPPDTTDGYVFPAKSKLRRDLRTYLLPSPYIESTDRLIRDTAEALIGEKRSSENLTAWERVEAAYDWVREHVEYRKDTPPKSSVAAMQDGFGDCDELSSLFIAICRAGGVPARMVRVPGHCYPEFYLTDEEGQGHWFPCQAAGTWAFGGMPDGRPILQKGDNFRIRGLDPHTRRPTTKAHRFPPETLTGLPLTVGGSPRMRVVCERVDKTEYRPKR